MKSDLLKLNIQLFAEETDLSSLFATINETLKDVKSEDITSESTDTFASLPDGYYFTEVESVKLTESKTSGKPMVVWQLKNIEEGITQNEDGEREYIRNSINKKHFIYHTLKDAPSIERFISDALKFEGEERGVPFLEKEYFATAETMSDALELLEGMYIWVHVDTTENNDGSSSTWTRFVTFARAVKLGLEQE